MERFEFVLHQSPLGGRPVKGESSRFEHQPFGPNLAGAATLHYQLPPSTSREQARRIRRALPRFGMITLVKTANLQAFLQAVQAQACSGSVAWSTAARTSNQVRRRKGSA